MALQMSQASQSQFSPKSSYQLSQNTKRKLANEYETHVSGHYDRLPRGDAIIEQ
jgi:hypothetical protein